MDLNIAIEAQVQNKDKLHR